MSSARALQLKEEGNKYFQSNDFAQAEALYSKAINADPQSPLLYTNRAMARLKLSLHEGVIEDCAASLKLLPHNMKAHYYRAQALLALQSPQEALEAAKEAYQLAYLSGDRGWERSLGNIVALILKIKKVAWEKKEAKRLKEKNKLRDQVIAALRKEMEEQLEGAKADQAEEDLKKEYEEKIEEVKRVWQKAAEGDEKRREVPDWMIDDITFAIMVDPVITKTGNSYERASIMEHLRRSTTDPLTREPLRIDELRPNLALREACEAFLEENGWAVDY